MEISSLQKTPFLFQANIICQPFFSLFSFIIPPPCIYVLSANGVHENPLNSYPPPPFPLLPTPTYFLNIRRYESAQGFGHFPSGNIISIQNRFKNTFLIRDYHSVGSALLVRSPRQTDGCPHLGARSDIHKAANTDSTCCPRMLTAYQHTLCSGERKPVFSIKHSLSSAGYSALHISANSISVFLHPLPMFLLFVKLSSICSGI